MHMDSSRACLAHMGCLVRLRILRMHGRFRALTFPVFVPSDRAGVDTGLFGVLL